VRINKHEEVFNSFDLTLNLCGHMAQCVLPYGCSRYFGIGMHRGKKISLERIVIGDFILTVWCLKC